MNQLRMHLNLVVLAFYVFVTTTGAAEVPAQLPKRDGKPAEHSKPIKVYAMLGQSNMLGFGRVGPQETKWSLEFMVKENEKYPHHLD